MKIILVFILVTFTLGIVQGISQMIPAGIFEVFYPCAKEVGMNEYQILDVREGDLSGLKDVTGCFSDCVSKKIGVLTDDKKFHADVLLQRISRFVKEDQAKFLMDKCLERVGLGKCNITGMVYECIIENMFSITLK